MKFKKWFKFISYLLVSILILSNINVETAIANPISENLSDLNVSINMVESSDAKPQISIEYGGITPEQPMVGQEFEVTYHINPQPFQYNVSKPKEIVLVLDGSGSMSTVVACEHGRTNSHWDNGKYCTPNTRLEELKEAAISFIEKMKSVDNLKIGIVVYSSLATINPITRGSDTYVTPVGSGSASKHNIPSYSSLTNPYFLDVTDGRLVTMINNIKALGGTNTGEGLRKAEFLLRQGNKDANKSIIFMSDGLPTFYSVQSNNYSSYYMDINNSNPNISGAGNETNTSSVEKSVSYATSIGSQEISGNGYNIFSIGYGLGGSTSNGNVRMQAIHRAMGGSVNLVNPDDPNNTFFATSEGAIESVFDKIADVLINSYSINDVKLDLKLASGIESVNINGNEIAIDPIVYEIKENNWYMAESQIVKFKVKATQSGDISLFGEGSKFSYTDIQGHLQTVDIPNPTFNIRPYDVAESEKLGVTFRTDKTGYLIGDKVIGQVIFTHSGINNINYTNAKFTLDSNSKPTNLITDSSYNKTLNFGTIDSTKMMTYGFTIADDSNIVSEAYTQYSLMGSYEYKINGTKESGDGLTANVNIKRGQIKIKVNDSIGNDITRESKVVIKYSGSGDEIEGMYSSGYIVFDTVPTGNHEIILKEVPADCTIDSETNNKIINVDFNNPVKTEVFTADGKLYQSELEVKANLKGFTPSRPFVNDEIIVTYEINPSDIYLGDGAGGNISKEIEEAIFIVDLSEKMLSGQRWGNLKNSIPNKILSNTLTSKISMGVVGYNSNTYVGNVTSFEPKVSSLEKVNSIDGLIRPLVTMHNNGNVNGNATDAFSNLFKSMESIMDNDKTPDNARDINKAIQFADDILTQRGDPDKGKAIVFISSGGSINVNNTMLNSIKTKGYRIITLDLSNEAIDINNIKSAHNSLGGVEDDYIIGTVDNGSNFNSTDKDLQKIADRLLGSTLGGDSNTKVSPILNFDIGNSLEYVNNSNSSNAKISTNGSKMIITLPEIEFKDDDADGTYSAEKFTITFKLKIKDVGNGTITFNYPEDKLINNIKYIDFNNREVKNLVETPVITIRDDEEADIKILEIEPADSFKISNLKGQIKTGTEKTVVDINGEEYVVEIEHISMPEFVGKVEKLNGKYDAIVIGRFNDYDNINNNKNKDQLNYIDYNNTDKWNNDITVRKFNEILDFINIGQLVYVDKNIGNIQVTNMKNFNQLFSSSIKNCVTDLSVAEITIEDIVSKYISLDDDIKRVRFTTTNPQGDSVDAEKGDPSNRKMLFNINISSLFTQESETVDINLYLDINGDGLFSEEEISEGQVISSGELVKSLKTVPIGSSDVTLDYQIASDFIGYLDWKVEIIKSNGVKSYISNLENDKNKLLFRSLTGEKLPIKVLQVAPYENDKLSDDIQGNLNLGPVEQGGNLRFNLLLQQVKDYDIQIQVISMNEFNERVGNTDNELVLNGNYDMIIFGFGDTYNGQQYDINDTAAMGLKGYINTGQSVMFTHDTFWEGSSGKRIKYFLADIGQVKELSTPLEWHTTQSKIVYQANEALITNYPFDLDESLKIRRTHKQWYQLDLESESVVPWYTITPYTVGVIDSISDYEGEVPQDILDELKLSGLVQSEMEQDDINAEYSNFATIPGTPWLWKEDTTPGDREEINKVNQYDVKNFYYTYSVGNIVFSGTAENTKEKFTPYPTEELKLFVNTIAKAIRGANHAPIITESNIYEGMEIDKEQESFAFSATFTDIDNDSIRNEIYIDSVKVTDVITSINGNLISDETNFDEYYRSGTSIEYSVPKKYYEGKDSVEIVIRAIDNGGKNGTDGAQSEKIFNIIPTILPISVSVQGNNYLVGEKLSTYINIDELNTAEKTLNSVSIKLNNLESSLLELASTSPTLLNHNLNVEDLKNAPVKCEYIFEAKESIQGYKVSGVIEYSYTNIGSNDIHSKSIPIDIPINIKEGYITTSVFNYSTETLSDNISITLNNHNKLFESMNSIRFSPLVSGEYNATLNGINEGLRVEVAGDNPTTINYDNPNAEYVFSVYNATTLIHGIYEGLSSDDIGIYEYPEDESVGREYARNTVVPFAASFNANKGSSPEIVLIPGGDFSYIQGTPSIFKIVEGNNKISLEKIGDMEIKNTMDGNRFVYKLQNVEENMKVVVMYNYELKGTAAWYTNRVLVYGNIFKDAKVKIMTDGINDSQLPDLF